MSFHLIELLMEQKEIDEIVDYLNEKLDANIPSFVKILVSKKIHKFQSFDPCIVT